MTATMTPETLLALADKADLNTNDGCAVVDFYGQSLGMTQDEIDTLVATDLASTVDWPEDQGISGSDLAEWKDQLGTKWLDNLIALFAAK